MMLASTTNIHRRSNLGLVRWLSACTSSPVSPSTVMPLVFLEKSAQIHGHGVGSKNVKHHTKNTLEDLKRLDPWPQVFKTMSTTESINLKQQQQLPVWLDANRSPFQVDDEQQYLDFVHSKNNSNLIQQQLPANTQNKQPNDNNYSILDMIVAVNDSNMPQIDRSIVNTESMEFMNRNGRRPKRANHGSRPCSRVKRRERKEALGRRRRT